MEELISKCGYDAWSCCMLGSQLRALFHAQFCPVQVSPLVQGEVKCWGF